MRRLCVAEQALLQSAETGGLFVSLPFYLDDCPLDDTTAPRWGMSLRKARSMRFRWNETNENRDYFLQNLCRKTGTEAVSLELIHSKEVYAVSASAETVNRQADGIITQNRMLLPVVTVADCMPVFLYDPVSGVFGSLHSGWKGTGIIAAALQKAKMLYGTRPENVCVALGPHIRRCCYIVDEKRAAYFCTEFSADCIEPVTEQELAETCAVPDWNSPGKKLFRLSLECANLALLDRIGVRPQNITVASDCTCCNDLFGSFRRETAALSSDTALEDKWHRFTVQAAFCGFF